MNKMVQFILTPKGERMAVLPAADYEAMIEELQDVREADGVKRTIARIRSGEEEMIPHDVVKRIVVGRENPIKVYREYRGMTTKALGEAAGVSQGYISMIETGRRKGTIEGLRNIARVLRVGLDELVTEQ